MQHSIAVIIELHEFIRRTVLGASIFEPNTDSGSEHV